MGEDKLACGKEEMVSITALEEKARELLSLVNNLGDDLLEIKSELIYTPSKEPLPIKEVLTPPTKLNNIDLLLNSLKTRISMVWDDIREIRTIL
ncbi:MAG: hypothetical protein PHI02_04455 [Sulfurovaceae bacterium]|nr:hypothetical protein [Sulfurovaceae bacterium]